MRSRVMTGLLLLVGCSPPGDATPAGSFDAAYRSATAELEVLRERVDKTGLLRGQCPGYVADPVPEEELRSGKRPSGQAGFRPGARAGSTGVVPAPGRCSLARPCRDPTPFRAATAWRALDFDPTRGGAHEHAASYAYRWSVEEDMACEVELEALVPQEDGTYTRRSLAGRMKDGVVHWGEPIETRDLPTSSLADGGALSSGP